MNAGFVDDDVGDDDDEEEEEKEDSHKKQVMMTAKQKLWLERGHPTYSGDDKEEGDDHDGDGIDEGHD